MLSSQMKKQTKYLAKLRKYTCTEAIAIIIIIIKSERHDNIIV